MSERRRWGNRHRPPRDVRSTADAPPRGELAGWIVFVVEDRVRIVDDLGRGYLLTLSRRARVSPDALSHWAEEGRRVMVRYSGTPDLGAVAESVRPVDRTPRPTSRGGCE